ncbi:MAG: cation:proton antiporter [Verrucomicrobiota bacterium]
MGGHSQHEIILSLTVALSVGAFLLVLARKINQPGIILLLPGGVLLGPEFIGWVHPESLEGFLPVIVSLAVGIILFEGGLTLDVRGYKSASGVIKRLLTLGVLVTWLGSAVCVYFLFNTDISFALLAGSMIIVTGPTVIVPLLRRIQVKQKLHSILHWEGVLIDPIGVFVAILCFEWVVGDQGGMALTNFLMRVVIGLGIGVGGGYLIYLILKKQLIPEEIQNSFTLAAAVFIFGITEFFISEGGLMAVTAAGFVVGWKHPVDLKEIKKFKAEITDLLIGLLFILLAARLEFDAFKQFGWNGVCLLLLVILIVRPVNIFVCSWKSDLMFKDKLFLSWVAPRGIVAASMASLFALNMEAKGQVSQAELLEVFIYAVISATVLLQGLTAGPLAGLLDVRRKQPTGWLIVGAHGFGRGIARFLKEYAKLHVVLIDTNPRMVVRAKREDLMVIREDAHDISLLQDRLELQAVGNLLALTDNAELNELLCQRWSDRFGKEHVFRWSPKLADRNEPREGIGQVFCSELASPSVIAGELAAGESHLDKMTVTKSGPFQYEGLHLLLKIANNKISPAVHSQAEMIANEGDELFVIRRTSGYLWRGIQKGGVMNLKARDLKALYHQLVDYAVELFPTISAEKVMEQLLEHDRVFPPSMGHGIAVPHVFSSKIRHRVCLLARLDEGLILEDEKEPLRLVFFVLSPSGDPEGHLTTLGEVARFCADEQNRQFLNTAQNAEAVKIFLKSRLKSSS